MNYLQNISTSFELNINIISFADKETYESNKPYNSIQDMNSPFYLLNSIIISASQKSAWPVQLEFRTVRPVQSHRIQHKFFFVFKNTNNIKALLFLIEDISISA